MDYLFHIVPAVAVGLQITLKIFIITIVLSLPLGILMAIGRISKIAILRKAMYVYIYVMRGTPLMLQILFIYYGLPFIIDGLKLPAFPAAIIARLSQPLPPVRLTPAHTLPKSSAAASSPSTAASMKGRKSWV